MTIFCRLDDARKDQRIRSDWNGGQRIQARLRNRFLSIPEDRNLDSALSHSGLVFGASAGGFGRILQSRESTPLDADSTVESGNARI
jgi:hypothetical protein